MHRIARPLMCLAIVTLAMPAPALTPGTDVLVPAAGRAGNWVTDLYIMNPGLDETTVEVSWLVRGESNENPTTMSYDVAGGETLVLTDVISSEFGLETGSGAFRITAGTEVIVNSRIFSQGEDRTFGQGFEGVPMTQATEEGETADVLGLSVNDAFRTNFFACAGPDGVSMSLSLVGPDGSELASRTRTLGAWMPVLQNMNGFMPVDGGFDNATLRVLVTAGSAVVGASKVDEGSTDPTTLESSVTVDAIPVGDVNGTYQFAIYDELSYATGGNLAIEEGALNGLNGTYTNWDKLDDSGDSACKWILLFGENLPTPTTLADLENGIEFAEDYTSHGLGVMTYTLALEVHDNFYITGTIDAVGSDFPVDVDGCNGEFPQLVVRGGRLPAE